MYTRPWTPEEDRRLREALLEGATQSEAGEELGRTRPAVALRCEYLGIKWRAGTPVNPYRRAQILLLLKLGLSQYKISKQLGVCSSTVYRTIVRMVNDGLLKRVVIDGRVRYLATNDREMRRAKKERPQQAQAQVPTDQRKHSA